MIPSIRRLRTLLALTLAALLAGCVYRVDVQQGNLLDDEDIEAVKVGMTRNQVRFLLGTPVVQDPFHPDRWDYMYYLHPGTRGILRLGSRSSPRQRWVIVWFDDDTVREISRDVSPKRG